MSSLSGWWFQAFQKIWKSVGMIYISHMESHKNMFQTTNQFSHQNNCWMMLDGYPAAAVRYSSRLSRTTRKVSVMNHDLYRCHHRFSCVKAQFWWFGIQKKNKNPFPSILLALYNHLSWGKSFQTSPKLIIALRSYFSTNNTSFQQLEKPIVTHPQFKVYPKLLGMI